MKVLMRLLIRSRLIWNVTVCKRMSEFTRCPKLPDLTLKCLDVFSIQFNMVGLTLLILMDFPEQVDTIRMGVSIL